MGIVYAILKNGMWDDPGVANTGSIAKKFSSRATDAGFTTGRIAPYLTWRFCYLVCGVVFGVARLAVGWPWNVNGGGDKYTSFLKKQLPKAVDPARFDGLVDFLAYEELAVWCVTFVSFCLVVAATCTSIPSLAISYARLSRRLLWGGWLAAFLPPFCFFLVFPIRSVADWDGVVTDVCTFSVKAAFDMPGSDLRKTISSAAKNGILEASLEGVLQHRAWCEIQGAGWYDSFYGVSVGCAWAAEDECSAQYCSKATGDVTQCLQSCMTYAISKFGGKEVKKVLLARMSACTDKSRPFVLGKPPALPSGAQATSKEGLMSMFASISYGQRRAIVEGSEAVALASVQAEYVVGILIAVVTARYLVPSALSLLGGLAEALLNNKAVFPGSQQGAWILILTTCEVVPIFASLLAMLQQLIGDAILAVACVLGTLFTSLGIVTGVRLLGIKSGDSEREKMYGKIWFEYVLKALFAVGILVTLIIWVTIGHDGLKKYMQTELLTMDVILLGVVDVLSKKVITAVAGTDLVMFACVQTETWYAEMPDADKNAHAAEVRDFEKLVNPNSTLALTPGGVQLDGVKIGKDAETE